MNVVIQRHVDGALVDVPELAWHTFSDGCPHINVAPSFVGVGNVFVVSLQSGRLQDLVVAEMAVLSLCESYARRVVLFVPYLPGARQDKGVPPVAGMVNALLRRCIEAGALVVASDAHSPTILSNLPVREVEAVDLVPSNLLGPGVGIIAPDAGATMRAYDVAKAHDLPLFQGSKHRDPSNNFRIASYSCDEVTTERALVVDDICDGGGTFIALAKATGLPRERLALWTTHGIYANGVEGLHEHYGVIACSDSLPTSGRADVVVPLRPHLLSALKDFS